MKIEGTEYCGHCNSDFDFEVEEDVWVVPCKTCGRPTVLCDKCHTMELDGDCDAHCKQCVKCDKLVKEWMKGEIGKTYFVDKDLFLNAPSNIENGWYKVLKFDKGGYYILENIDTKKKIKTYGEVIDYKKNI